MRRKSTAAQLCTHANANVTMYQRRGGSVHLELVLHGHDLDHVEIDGHVGFGDALHGGDDGVRHLVGKLGLQLCAQRGAGHREEQLAVGERVGHGRLEALKELECVILRLLVPVGDLIEQAGGRGSGEWGGGL